MNKNKLKIFMTDYRNDRINKGSFIQYYKIYRFVSQYMFRMIFSLNTYSDKIFTLLHNYRNFSNCQFFCLLYFKYFLLYIFNKLYILKPLKY